MDASINAPKKSPKLIVEWVWYEGIDALGEGEAVSYNNDIGPAAEVDGRRHNHVERPGAGTKTHEFAGVAARNYSAEAGGQLIEIYIPGSRGVKVRLDTGEAATIGTGTLTFASGGKFAAGTHYGRGSAIPRQTAGAAEKCQADLLVGDVLQAAAEADSTASDVAGVVADLNSLLGKLRASGVLAGS